MDNGKLQVVTGAFGYSGSYITRLLLERGDRVRTLTGHPRTPASFSGSVEAVPFNFDQPDKLAASLAGADTLFNTYWIQIGRAHV